MAQSQPINVYTVEQVREIARRAKRRERVTMGELRALGFYVQVMGVGHRLEGVIVGDEGQH